MKQFYVKKIGNFLLFKKKKTKRKKTISKCQIFEKSHIEKRYEHLKTL